nr:hypothetical protein [Tanacetum cinerariifolium]
MIHDTCENWYKIHFLALVQAQKKSLGYFMFIVCARESGICSIKYMPPAHGSVGMMSGDTILLRDAMGEKVFKALLHPFQSTLLNTYKAKFA